MQIAWSIAALISKSLINSKFIIVDRLYMYDDICIWDWNKHVMYIYYITKLSYTVAT